MLPCCCVYLEYAIVWGYVHVCLHTLISTLFLAITHRLLSRPLFVVFWAEWVDWAEPALLGQRATFCTGIYCVLCGHRGNTSRIQRSHHNPLPPNSSTAGEKWSTAFLTQVASLLCIASTDTIVCKCKCSYWSAYFSLYIICLILIVLLPIL